MKKKIKNIYTKSLVKDLKITKLINEEKKKYMKKKIKRREKKEIVRNKFKILNEEETKKNDRLKITISNHKYQMNENEDCEYGDFAAYIDNELFLRVKHYEYFDAKYHFLKIKSLKKVQ